MRKYFVRELSFPSKNLVSDEYVSFIYPILMLFSKIAYFFKQTQSSIEIDVTLVKKHVILNFVEKYLR